MSGWKVVVRVIVVVIAVVAGSGRALAGVEPTALPADPLTATVSLAEVDFSPALPAAPAADPALEALPAPVATQAAPAVVPLPPGVVFGLVGLASAAIARRRYLRRR